MIGLLMLGTTDANSGMYQYYKCWENQLEIESREYTPILPRSILAPGENIISFDSYIEEVGYRKYPGYIFLNYKKIIKEVKELCSNITKQNVTEIWILDSFVFSSLYVYLISKFFLGKIRITIHDPIPHEGSFKSKFSKIIFQCNQRLLRVIAQKRTVYIHIHGKNLVRGSLWENISKIEYITHPLPKTLTHRKRKKTSQIRFLFAGRIEPYKGLGNLLEAMIVLCEQAEYDQDFELYIVGRGAICFQLVNKLQKYINVVLDNDYVSSELFHQYIADTDVMVCPYISATASGVSMLGVAYNIPLLVTDVGELALDANMVKGSRVISPNDLNALVIALQKFITLNKEKNMINEKLGLNIQ